MTAVVRHYSRADQNGAITVHGSSAASSTPIPYGDVAGGTVIIPASSGLTTLTWWAYDEQNNAWCELENTSGTPVQNTGIDASANAVAQPIPDECYGCHKIACVGNTAGTIYVDLKG